MDRLEAKIDKYADEMSSVKVLLEHIKTVGENTLEQTKKTNGRVNGHDIRLDKVDGKINYAAGAVAVVLLFVMPLLVYIFNLYVGSNQIKRAVDNAIEENYQNMKYK